MITWGREKGILRSTQGGGVCEKKPREREWMIGEKRSKNLLCENK